MNKVFTQPAGSTAIYANKQSIARTFSISEDLVSYAASGINLSSYKILYDEENKKCFWVGDSVGIVYSYDINQDGTSLSVSTENKETFILPLAMPGDWQTAQDIKLSQGGSIQDALKDSINVEQFSYLVTNDDWQPAFKAAIAVAIETKQRVVTFSGVKNLKSVDSVGWVSPFDDGTIDARRTEDSQMPPEQQVTYPVHINLPSVISIKARDPNYDSLVSVWDGSTLDNTQPIVICKRVLDWDGSYTSSSSAKNRMTRAIWGSDLGGFTIENAMIGIVSDGIESRPNWGNISFKNVGIGVAMMGVESGKISRITYERTRSVLSIGGWWLQRNDVKFQGGLYIPPYTSSAEIYCLGWIDSLVIEELEGTFVKHTDSGMRQKYYELDKFYDEVFWKTANSTPLGQTTVYGVPGRARLSKYGPSLTTGLSTLEKDNPYRGVAMRALSAASRYNRGNSNNEIMKIKSRYTPRGPIWINNDQGPAGINLIVHNAYIEDSGKASYSNSSRVAGGPNDWFASGLDELNKDISQMQYYIGQGPITSQFINNTASIVCNPSFSNHGGGGPKRNIMVGLNDGSTRWIESTTLFDPSNGNYTVIGTKYTTYDFIKRISFTTDTNYSLTNMFRYGERVLASGDLVLFSKTGSAYTALSPTNVSARMVRTGNRTKLYISFNLSSGDVSNTGQFVVGVKRYKIYDTSSSSGVGTYPALQIARGSFKTQSVSTTSGGTYSIELTPKTLQHIGYVSVGDSSYHMISAFSDSQGITIYPVSNMINGTTMTFVIEYESFSDIDSITLT